MKKSYFRYVKKYKFKFSMIIILTILSSFLLTYPIQLMRELIDGMTEPESFELGNFILYSSVYVLCILFSAIGNSLRVYLSSKLKLLISSDIRKDIQEKRVITVQMA